MNRCNQGSHWAGRDAPRVVRQPPHYAAAVRLLGVACALAAAGSASADPAALAAGPVAYAQAVASCSYGYPQLDGDNLLIPKVCRHELQGKAVVRHSVEAKRVTTGARVQQASLPPIDAPATGLPAVGTLLPGAPPLLVTAEGIGGVDLRAGRAELAFTPEGTLAAVARHGSLLAVVDRRDREDARGQMVLEVSVLDLDAGEPVGAAIFADGQVTALAFSGQGVAAQLRLCVPQACFDLSVRDSDGKPAARDGRLASRKEPALAAAAASTAAPASGTCPLVRAPLAALPGDKALSVASAPAAITLPASVPQAWVGAATCLAVVAVPRTAAEPLWLAWTEQAGVRVLRSTVPASPPATTAPPPAPAPPAPPR